MLGLSKCHRDKIVFQREYFSHLMFGYVLTCLNSHRCSVRIVHFDRLVCWTAIPILMFNYLVFPIHLGSYGVHRKTGNGIIHIVLATQQPVKKVVSFKLAACSATAVKQ